MNMLNIYMNMLNIEISISYRKKTPFLKKMLTISYASHLNELSDFWIFPAALLEKKKKSSLNQHARI